MKKDVTTKSTGTDKSGKEHPANSSHEGTTTGGSPASDPEPAQTGKPDPRRHLRWLAEDRLAEHPALSPDNKVCTTDQIIHDLQVHQIELEMQNEALRDTQQALEESRDKYDRSTGFTGNK